MSLLRRHYLLGYNKPPITYVGSASVPADNGTNGSSPMTVTPPSGMKQGDLVFVSMFVGSNGRTGSVSTTGGQSWTLVKNRDAATPEIWTAWCTFNGSWSANPQFSISGTGVMKSAIMHVFRPPRPGMVWAVDQAAAGSTDGSTATPTITGITNTKRNNVTIATFVNSLVSTTVTAISGTNWHHLGTVQYRNNGSNARLGTYAYQIQGVPGATGNVTKTTGSPASWFKFIESWYCS